MVSTDDDQGTLSRPHPARKDVPVERQDTLRVRVRARRLARGRQAYEIRLVFVSCPIFSIRPSRLLFFPGWLTRPRPTASNPPPRDLKVSDPAIRDLTLAELELAPSSVLLLRFLDDTLNRTSRLFSSPLSSHPLMCSLSPSSLPLTPPSPNRSELTWLIFSPGSDLPAPLASAVLEHAVDLPPPQGSGGDQKPGEVSSRAPSASSSANKAKDSTGGDVKIPKWLKLGHSTFINLSHCPLLVTFSLQRSDALHPHGLIKPFITLRGTACSCSDCCSIFFCRNPITSLDTWLTSLLCHLNYVHMYYIPVQVV